MAKRYFKKRGGGAVWQTEHTHLDGYFFLQYYLILYVGVFLIVDVVVGVFLVVDVVVGVFLVVLMLLVLLVFLIVDVVVGVFLVVLMLLVVCFYC